jgi:hypothetical protein
MDENLNDYLDKELTELEMTLSELGTVSGHSISYDGVNVTIEIEFAGNEFIPQG